jgi:hypothetical protein
MIRPLPLPVLDVNVEPAVAKAGSDTVPEPVKSARSELLDRTFIADPVTTFELPPTGVKRKAGGVPAAEEND